MYKMPNKKQYHDSTQLFLGGFVPDISDDTRQVDLMPAPISVIKSSLSDRSKVLKHLEVGARKRRHELLMRLLSSFVEPPSILDVGGTVEYWSEVELPASAVRQLVVLNTFKQKVYKPFESVVGDARDLSRYSNGQFDLVFSNSVIGHVGGFDDQMKMASEVRRVGKHFFLQSPNQGFIVDWRTLMPLFHFLPVVVQAWCFERFGVGKYRKASTRDEALDWATRVRNIRRSELASLFPNAAVVNERVFGMTKSFVVHNFGIKNRSDIDKSYKTMSEHELSLPESGYM